MGDILHHPRQRRTQAERRDEEGVSAPTFEAIARRGGYTVTC